MPVLQGGPKIGIQNHQYYTPYTVYLLLAHFVCTISPQQDHCYIRKLFELYKGVGLDAYCLSNIGEVIFKSHCEQTGSIFSGVFCWLVSCTNVVQ